MRVLRILTLIALHDYLFGINAFLSSINSRHKASTNFLLTKTSVRYERTNHRMMSNCDLELSINEWRESSTHYFESDLYLSEEEKSDKLAASKINDGSIFPREICLLPFPYEEMLLQGETKELRLYEDRFIELFEKSINEHGGVIGMGLLVNQASLLKPVPICVIESFNRMPEFGVFCTIRAVSRATLIRFTSYDPYMTAICVEKTDDKHKLGKKQFNLLNYLASNIENTIVTISSLEYQLKQKQRETDIKADADADADVNDVIILFEGEEGDESYLELSNADSDLFEEDDDDDDEHDSESYLYLDVESVNDEIDDEDEEEEDDDDDSLLRFRKAFQEAKETDCQGYTTFTIKPTSERTSSNSAKLSERTIQDLNAISWAAFCFKPMIDIDVTLRIQVLDSSRLLDRLYVGNYVVREKKKELENKLGELMGKKNRKKQRERDDDLDNEK